MTLVLAAKSSDGRIVTVADAIVYNALTHPIVPGIKYAKYSYLKVRSVADGIILGLSGSYKTLGSIDGQYDSFREALERADHDLGLIREIIGNKIRHVDEENGWVFGIATSQEQRILVKKQGNGLEEHDACYIGFDCPETTEMMGEYRPDMDTRRTVSFLKNVFRRTELICRDHIHYLAGRQVCKLSHGDGFSEEFTHYPL